MNKKVRRKPTSGKMLSHRGKRSLQGQKRTYRTTATFEKIAERSKGTRDTRETQHSPALKQSRQLRVNGERGVLFIDRTTRKEGKKNKGKKVSKQPFQV